VPDGTPCIDDFLGEVELPPPPPYGIFDARSIGSPGSPCLGQGVVANFHGQAGNTQGDTFVVAFQSGSPGYAMEFAWDNLASWFSGAARMTDPFGGIAVDVDMTAQTAYSLNDERIRSLVIMTGPAPLIDPLPALLTGMASSVSGTDATLNGQINPNGFETTAWFEYGMTPAYGSTTASQSAGSGTGIVPVSQPAGGLSPGMLYHSRLVAQNVNGLRYGPDVAFTTGGVTGVDEPAALPDRFILASAYPNPFNPSTVIEYGLPEAARVTIAIYNVSGQNVRTLVDRDEAPGMRSVVFDATGLPSGVYYCRMTAGSFVRTTKLALVR